MKTDFFGWFGILAAVFAIAAAQAKIPERILPAFRLEELGIPVSGEQLKAEPIIGACACHSPFGKAAIMGSDRIVSVDGLRVRTFEDVRLIFERARKDSRKSVSMVLEHSWHPAAGRRSVRVEVPYPS